jgi:hypothetical protein
MAKMQRPNRITAIAPSEVLESGIHIDRYSDRIADIYYALDAEQIYLIDGYAEKLGTCALEATQSIKDIEQRLQVEYKIPESVFVRHRGALADIADIYADGAIEPPAFYKETKDQNRKMALIADELQMSVGRNALEALQMECVEFPVVPPRFGNHTALQPPVSIDVYRSTIESFEPLALTGDS